MDAKSLLLRMHIRRILRRLVGVTAIMTLVFAWATGRIDPFGGIARTYAFVKEKGGGKHHAVVAVADQGAGGHAATAGGKLDNQTLCLAHAVYFDAGNDPRDVQVAVAQVVLNRAVTPKGTTDMRALCRVVYRGLGRPLGCLYRNTCQNIGTLPDDEARWAKAVEVAKDVASGHAQLPALIQHASHFHGVGPRPAWTSTVYRLTRVGRMVFYSPKPMEALASLGAADSTSPGKLAAPAAASTAPDMKAAVAGAPAVSGTVSPKAALTSGTSRASAAKPQREKAADAAGPSVFSDMVR